MYNTGIQDLLDGTIIWTGGSKTTQYARLLTASYSIDVDHDYLDHTSGGTMSQGAGNTSQSLADNTPVATLDTANDEVQADCGDETYAALAAGDTPSQIAVYKYNAADASAELLCNCLLTTPPAPNGGDYTIVWDAEGVFEISN